MTIGIAPPQSPRVATMTALIVCMRFSASSPTVVRRSGKRRQAAATSNAQRVLVDEGDECSALGGVAFDRAGHAAWSATPTAQFASGDGDHLDTVLAQEGV